MQTIIITGSLGRDAELKRTKTGDEVLSFPVGVTQGYGDSKTTNWYRCSMWGKRAVNLQQYLMKGVKVAVAGEMKTGEYEGKTQLNIDVATLDFMSRGEASAPRKQTDHDKAKQNGYQRDDYLEDEAPF